jgi:hypothetical protein
MQGRPKHCSKLPETEINVSYVLPFPSLCYEGAGAVKRESCSSDWLRWNQG